MTFSFLMAVLLYMAGWNPMLDSRFDGWAGTIKQGLVAALIFAGIFLLAILLDRWSYTQNRPLPKGFMTDLMTNSSRTIGFGLLACVLTNALLVRDFFGLAWLSSLLFYSWVFFGLCFLIFLVRSVWQGSQYFLTSRKPVRAASKSASNLVSSHNENCFLDSDLEPSR